MGNHFELVDAMTGKVLGSLVLRESAQPGPLTRRMWAREIGLRVLRPTTKKVGRKAAKRPKA